MAVSHQRLGLLARWLRRCPACGEWFALRVTQKDKSALGVKKKYLCSKCNAQQQDWVPSDQVKF